MATRKAVLSCAPALLLSACGGGGAGSGIASAPTPPAAALAAPVDAPVKPPEHLGLVSAEPFAVSSASLSLTSDGTEVAVPDRASFSIRYLSSSNTYEVTLPSGESGRLETYFNAGPRGGVATWTDNHLVGAAGAYPDIQVHMPVPGSSGAAFSYTSWGEWSARGDAKDDLGKPINSSGVFAYGIPTKSGDVPISGSADYHAGIHGFVHGGPAAGYVASGDVDLHFDFGAGLLSGSMHAYVPEGGWAGVANDQGIYSFANTQYAAGATTFAGAFDVPKMPTATSRFSGSFTGPRAAEVMARFEAPLSDGNIGTLTGVWIGKRN